MDYWPILVLAAVRLGCNLNYGVSPIPARGQDASTLLVAGTLRKSTLWSRPPSQNFVSKRKWLPRPRWPV